MLANGQAILPSSLPKAKYSQGLQGLLLVAALNQFNLSLRFTHFPSYPCLSSTPNSHSILPLLTLNTVFLLSLPLQEKAMKKIYHLSSCNTCQRIISDLELKGDVELQDIKQENIDEATLDMIKEKVGSYEALFSKRAMKYRSMGLNEMNLSEADYKKYMLEEYTFLKRPFIILEDEVFVGNSKKVVEAAKKAYQA